MTSRNLKKSLSSPLSRKGDANEGVPVDKRRKVTRGVNMAREVRTRAMNNVVQDVVQKSVAAPPVSNEDTECGVTEFTKEDVEALLNERFKPKKKFDQKEKSDYLAERVKKLKLCIKWFQELEGNYLVEQENLRNMIELAEKKYNELEVLKQNKEEELNSIIMELRNRGAKAEQESFTKEELDKLAAMDSLTMEQEARCAAERLKASLSDDLGKSEQELASANKKVSSLNDMYKRLQEYNTSLQEYNSELQTDLAAANETLNQVEREKASLMQNLSTLRGHYTSLQDQLASFRTSQEDAIWQRETLATDVTCLRERCSSQSDQIRTLQDQLAAANRKLQVSDMCASETRTDYEEQKKLTFELQSRLAEAEHKILEGEVLRKRLHNTILELKGNIRVFCRVRPLLPDDGTGTEAKAFLYPTSTETGRGIDLMQNGQKHSFTFDKVLGSETSQEDCFVEISQLIQSALDGYKVCIFAYGQTSSGKTYTMMGKPGNHDQKGLIPRSLEQIFQTRQSLQNQGWKYEMQVSMLEIYNETIRDLLSSNRSSSDASSANAPAKQYAIKHDASGNTHISDLTIIDVRSSKEVSFLLDQAAQSRSVWKTQMNEQSSRSHFVFTLRISGTNESTKQQVQGVLNLIDLAGSERLSKSGATGERLKETLAINKSLSSLSDVIFALGKKEDHVPFRNSKLTYLLQPCLGGDSKTLMFVNISPDPASIGESLCSLRFAARVNACEIGVPRRQTNVKAADSRLSYG